MPLTVRRARWPSDREAIRSVREQVFVHEQSVPPELEWDGLDKDCAHVLVSDYTDGVVATGRLQADGKIGRMAVLASHRGRGVGGAVLTALLEIAAERGLKQVYLHAQTHAMAFYERHDFSPCGAEFEEAGIPHRSMRLVLGD